MKDLIRTLQRQLNNRGARLRVDGVVGARTIKAFRDSGKTVIELLEPKISALIDLVVQTTLDDERKKDTSLKQWFTLEELMPFIQEASSSYMVPVDEIVFFLDHEAEKRKSSGKIEYNSLSKSSTQRHFGLMQLYKGAWADAVMYDRRMKVNKLKTFSFNHVPRQSILAGAAFIRQNRIFAKLYDRYEGPFTTEIDYAMYNQGHTFVKRAKRGLFQLSGDQSGRAIDVLRVASEQLKMFDGQLRASI